MLSTQKLLIGFLLQHLFKEQKKIQTSMTVFLNVLDC